MLQRTQFLLSLTSVVPCTRLFFQVVSCFPCLRLCRSAYSCSHKGGCRCSPCQKEVEQDVCQQQGQRGLAASTRCQLSAPSGRLLMAVTPRLATHTHAQDDKQKCFETIEAVVCVQKRQNEPCVYSRLPTPMPGSSTCVEGSGSVSVRGREA